MCHTWLSKGDRAQSSQWKCCAGVRCCCVLGPTRRVFQEPAAVTTTTRRVFQEPVTRTRRAFQEPAVPSKNPPCLPRTRRSFSQEPTGLSNNPPCTGTPRVQQSALLTTQMTKMMEDCVQRVIDAIVSNLLDPTLFAKLKMVFDNLGTPLQNPAAYDLESFYTSLFMMPDLESDTVLLGSHSFDDAGSFTPRVALKCARAPNSLQTPPSPPIKVRPRPTRRAATWRCRAMRNCCAC